MKFKVTTSLPAIQYWTYIVDAETEEEAKAIALQGNLDPVDYDVQSDDTQSESIDEIEEFNDDTEE